MGYAIDFVVKMILEILKWNFTRDPPTLQNSKLDKPLVDNLHSSLQRFELRYGRPGDSVCPGRDAGAPEAIHQRY